MKTKLIKLLNNAYSPIDNIPFACAVETNSGQIFYGVSLKNSVYRDAIYAEQAALGAALSAGFKKGDFKQLTILIGSNNLDDIKNLSTEIILELLSPTAMITIMCLSSSEKNFKVSDLKTF